MALEFEKAELRITKEKEKLLNAVTQFKNIGGNSVTVSQPNYVFHAKSDATNMLESIGI